MEQSPSWEADSHTASQINSPPLVESEGSLPCSKQAATGPYPEPDESSPHLPTPFLFKIHSNIILPFTPRSSNGLFLSGFPNKILYIFSSLPCMLHVPPIHPRFVERTSYETPHYAVFSSLPLSS